MCHVSITWLREREFTLLHFILTYVTQCFAGRNVPFYSEQSLIIMRGIKSIFNFQCVSHSLSRDCEKGSLHILHYIRRKQLIVLAMSSTVAQGCAFQACLTAFALTTAFFLAPAVNQLITWFLCLWQNCPHRLPFTSFSSPATFLRTWNLWFSDQSTSPHMSGLISSTLCVLQKGSLSWQNVFDSPWFLWEELLSSFIHC